MTGLPHHSVFHFAGVFDGVAGPGFGFEAGLADGFAGAFADAVGAVLDFGEGLVDFAKKDTIFFDQSQGEFLLVVVGAHVGHVDGEVGEIGAGGGAEGFAFHGAHVADEFAALGEQEVAEMFQFGGGETGLVFLGFGAGGDAGLNKDRAVVDFGFFGGLERLGGDDGFRRFFVGLGALGHRGDGGFSGLFRGCGTLGF